MPFDFNLLIRNENSNDLFLFPEGKKNAVTPQVTAFMIKEKNVTFSNILFRVPL